MLEQLPILVAGLLDLSGRIGKIECNDDSPPPHPQVVSTSSRNTAHRIAEVKTVNASPMPRGGRIGVNSPRLLPLRMPCLLPDSLITQPLRTSHARAIDVKDCKTCAQAVRPFLGLL